MPQVDTRAVLNIYRLLQEVVSNAVRHSKAKNLSIKLQQDTPEASLIVKISDDGVGVPKSSEKPVSSKGLLNMKTRADKLGAKLEFGKGIDGQGFGITLTLPVDTH